jgi:general secretion pathway protein F
MPKFRYKAKKGPQEIVTGIVVAANADEAAADVFNQGLAVLEIVAEDPSAVQLPSKTAKVLFISRHVPAEQVALFTRQLYDLMEADVPVLWAFAVITKQIQHPKLKEIIRQVTVFIKGGGSLSAAMAQHPETFPPYYVNLIASGEMSGRLTEVLGRLAQFMEKDLEVRAKVKSGLTYPLVVLGVGLITIFVLLTFVLPRLAGIFEEFDAELPAVTQAVLSFSGFMNYTWYIWVLGAIGLVFLVKKLLSVSAYRSVFDKHTLNVPIIGDYIRQAELGRFGRTLGTMLENGVAIVPALESVSSGVSNLVLREELVRSAQRVKNGAALTEAMRQSPLFSEMALSMISVGEESGKMHKGLFKMADACERQTESLTSTFVTLVGPAVLVMIVMVVGFVILAMLLPIFQMNLIIN